MSNNLEFEEMQKYYVYVSFKITFPNGLVLFYNTYSDVPFELGKSRSDVINDYKTEQKDIIMNNFGSINILIEPEQSDIITDLNSLPKTPWISK